jgi:hypothetical protein
MTSIFRNRPRPPANTPLRAVLACGWILIWVVLGYNASSTSFGFSWRLFLTTVLMAVLPVVGIAFLLRFVDRRRPP